MLPINYRAALRKFLFSIFLLIFIFAVRDPAAALQQNGISAPTSGETLSGVVEVVGTAVHPEYLRYELAFLNEANTGTGWVVFAESTQPVQAGTLAIWDTTIGRDIGDPVFPDGRYRLRLRVVRNDYNYDEFFVTDLTIVNSGPTPEPTADETAVSLTVTAQSSQPELQTTADSSGFQQPTPLPSLTPFPTPTAQATAVGNTQAGATIDDDADSSGGVIGQIQAVDTNRFSQAFLAGIKVTLALFLLVALYLLIRRVGRYVWRSYWARKS